MKLNVVPAATGLQWVKLGIKTFFKQPLALAGLFFMYIAAVIVVSQIPVLGPVIGGVLVPAATLGLMAATAEATKGRFPMPSVLISAFRAGRQRLQAMLVLGVIYAAGSALASFLAELATGGMGSAVAPAAGAASAAGAAGAAGNEGVEAATLVAMAFHMPLFLMFWHAPALVHWHGVSPVKSLFFSVIACFRNFGAHLIYGLGWMAVFLGVGSVLGIVGGLLGGVGVARTLMMPMALLLAAMFSTSVYFTFRDSFLPDDETPEAP